MQCTYTPNHRPLFRLWSGIRNSVFHFVLYANSFKCHIFRKLRLNEWLETEIEFTSELLLILMFSFHSKWNGNLSCCSFFHSFILLSVSRWWHVPHGTWPNPEIVCWIKCSGIRFVTYCTCINIISIFFFFIQFILQVDISPAHFYAPSALVHHCNVIQCTYYLLQQTKRSIPIRNGSWLLGSRFQFYQYHFSCIILRCILSSLFVFCLTRSFFFQLLFVCFGCA